MPRSSVDRRRPPSSRATRADSRARERDEDEARALSPRDVPVFILCGGLGTRLGDAAGGRPKPMVEIGGQPLLMHIMAIYGRAGFRKFVLCAGHKIETIRSHFAALAATAGDFTVNLRSGRIVRHDVEDQPDWDITVVDTGERSQTGARVARAFDRFGHGASHFAVTYGDGLSDVAVSDLFRFHRSHDRLATVLGVRPPSQFGQFQLAEGEVAGFREKPEGGAPWINGGFFFFRADARAWLDADPNCALEAGPLQRLAAAKELALYKYDGFWSCMDTVRDRDRLRGLWESGAPPWLV